MSISSELPEFFPPGSVVITYEYPLHERVRTMLRLEDLFDKTAHFIAAEGAQEHHVALVTLFEILEIASRIDLKFDLVQELERQRQTLTSFRNNPDISEQALTAALHEIEQASAAVLNMQGKIGHSLRENEWLMSIKSRASIPGGVCEFDLPSYHYWLHCSGQARQADLTHWIHSLLPLRDGLAIILRLLRASGRPNTFAAQSGAFQLMLGGKTAQMIRLRVQHDIPFSPEISANKYALNIRFISSSFEPRSKQAEVDIPFEMTFCNL